jgi:hypothetical protein
MIKITFYPNDEARIVGSHEGSDGQTFNNDAVVSHFAAETVAEVLQRQSKDGEIEAQIVTIRKAGAYTIPKLDRVNDVFGMLDYLYG